MAVENFTTYTEVDPNSRITVTSTKVSAAGLKRNESAYVYSDKGVNHFSADWGHLLTADDLLHLAGQDGIVEIWAVANDIGHMGTLLGAGKNAHLLFFLHTAANVVNLYLYENDGG